MTEMKTYHMGSKGKNLQDILGRFGAVIDAGAVLLYPK